MVTKVRDPDTLEVTMVTPATQGLANAVTVPSLL
jgi:hypothetical protein